MNIEYISFVNKKITNGSLPFAAHEQICDVYDSVTGNIFMRIYNNDLSGEGVEIIDNNIIKQNNYHVDVNDIMFIELKSIIRSSKQKINEVEIYKVSLPNTIKLLTIVSGTSGKPDEIITREYLKSFDRDDKINIILKMTKKTASITIDNIKDTDGWFDMGNTLGLSEEKIYKTFEYGEYAKIQIIVDEDLNIIGGKIIPCGK